MVESEEVSRRRTRFDIMVDILSVSAEGANKTKIVYGANLNFKLANEYIGFLIDSDLLSQEKNKNGKIFTTTDKGMDLLNKFRELNDAVQL